MTELKEVCPICGSTYDNKYHIKIKYHISYKPEVIIYACSECNNVEYLERHGLLWDILRRIKRLRHNIKTQTK